MPITYAMMKQATADLYSWSLRKVPDDTKAALARARDSESNPVAQRTLDIMLKSAIAAETSDRFVCSDSGVPVYSIALGTRITMDGDIKQAVVDGFAA